MVEFGYAAQRRLLIDQHAHDILLGRLRTASLCHGATVSQQGRQDKKVATLSTQPQVVRLTATEHGGPDNALQHMAPCSTGDIAIHWIAWTHMHLKQS